MSPWRTLTVLLLLALGTAALGDGMAPPPQKAAADGGAKPGAVEWSFPESSPPRVHIAKGLWWEFFGWNAVAADLGGLHTSSYQSGVLQGFPGTPAALMSQNLIVLANVGAATLSAPNRVLLREYVRNGGAVLVLGGRFALDGGGYAGTPLEEILPCTLPAPNRLEAKPPLVLEAAPDPQHILPDNLAWSLRPHIYYYHTLVPRPGATVLAKAGDKPLLIVGAFGKGRVAVLGVSPEGDPAQSELAIWEWPDLPRMLSAVSRWLIAVPHAAAAQAAQDPASRQRLDDLLVPGGKDDAGREKEVIEVAGACHDVAFARDLLKTVVLADSTPSAALVDAVVRAVRPFAGAESSKELSSPADALFASGDEGKTALGCRIVGMIHGANAGERLAKAATHGREVKRDASPMFSAAAPKEVPAAGSGGAGAGSGGAAGDTGAALSAEMVMAHEDERVRLAAVIALGELGDPKYVDTLTRVTRDFADKRQAPPDISEIPVLDEAIYQESIVARVRLGDASAVGPMLEAYAKNEDDADQYKNACEDMIPPRPSETLRLRIIKSSGPGLQELAARQAAIREAACAAPYALAPTFVGELVQRDDQRLSPVAWAALCPTPKRTLTRETAAALLPLVEKASWPEQRMTAYRLVARINDADLTRKLAAVVVALASNPDPAAADFALNCVTGLGPQDRAAVLAATKSHPDADVRRLAGLLSAAGG